MTPNVRSEDDLRELFAELPSTAEAEKRLVAALRDGSLEVTREGPNWRVIGLSVAASAAVVATAVTVTVVRGNSTSPAPISSQRPGGSTTASPATVAITPQVAAQILDDLLTQSGTASNFGGTQLPGTVKAWLVLDDGRGAARIEADVTYPYRDSNGLEEQQPGTLCQGPDDAQSTCVTLANGMQLETFTGVRNPGKPLIWAVTLLRTDSVSITISEWNSRTELGSTVTRDEPPLSLQQLSALARSDQWTSQVSQDRAARARLLFTPDDEYPEPSQPTPSH
ncbi:MAG TPA: hypothetical protein VJ831_04240 [Jatrophihabitantaceae bacterium]|nr:hypothetical protein [Jatrophihabitantaceae bacterium]